jgi:class 3 adenylate cyclase/tetratricopeptide (TPR) repeat protein
VAATENVTVLFTDLVGSTELSTSLSSEAADDVRRRHFSTLRQAIATSGGTEVKNLGDGLMVVFPVASAALACAVAMQQAVHRDNATAERPLGLRVALSAGEATKEDGDYFGDPVIEAARLCARAEGGQILAADLVRANAGRRSPHVFTSVGELELKGLPEPLETLDVGWDPLTEEAATSAIVPLPARLALRPGVGVVGRAEELGGLFAALKRVAAGEGREVVLIAGEPGQGKTTLVAEVARHAQEEGMTVLLGRCDEELGAPYRPLQEALTHFVAHADEALLRSHVAAHGGELGRLVPALGQRLGELPAPQSAQPDTERYLLFGAAVGLLQLASAAAPLVLVLDDLHWADKPSLQLVRHVVANTSDARLLVLGTYRDAELSAAHPLTEALGDLHREPGFSTVDLKGLDDTGVLAFMEAAAGHSLDAPGVGLAHQVYRETDGNPFFVAEILRNLAESGAIYQDERSRWTARDDERLLALPHSVRAVIGSRLARLGEEATKLLSTASVIGRDFDLPLLAEASGVDEDTALDTLEQAQHAALVGELADSPGRYSFSHALVQHTLYEDLGPTRRTRVHRHVGEAIERLYGPNSEARVGELARHFFLATTPSHAEKAVSYAKSAGDAALRALAPEDAVRYFSQAIELASESSNVTPDSERIDLLIGLGTAQRQAGTGDSRTTLLDAARRARTAADTERLVAAVLANHRGWFTSLGLVDSDKVELLEAALDALGPDDSPQRARILATLCSELNYGAPLERRLALADEAKAIARRLGDTKAFVDVVLRCAVSTTAPTTLSSNLSDAAEAVAAAGRQEDPATLFLAHFSAHAPAVRAGQFDLARHHAEAVVDIADRLRQPAMLWTAGLVEAARALVHGDTASGEELAGIALQAGTDSGQPDALSFFGVQAMGAAVQKGTLGDLVSLIAEEADRHNTSIPAYRATLAAAHIEAGDRQAARTLMDQAAGASFAMPEDSPWFDGVTMYSRVAIELAHREYSEILVALLAPFHDQVVFDWLQPNEPAAMFLGGLATVLGRFDEADAYFTEADDLNRRGEMKFGEASTNMLWGRMLLARNGPGDADRARILLEQARDSSSSRGYAMVERRAIAELSKIG